jgi:hypothetical protein
LLAVWFTVDAGRVRQAYAHDARVRLAPGGDERALGAAITVELCGGWDHPPPCPLAPHWTGSQLTDGLLRLRVLFATEPEHEAAVRDGINAALGAGSFTGPDGVNSRWRLQDSRRGVVAQEETAHARRLIESWIER